MEFVIFEVFAVVTIKNAVFCDVTPRGSGNNQRFGGPCRLHHQGGISELGTALALISTCSNWTPIGLCED
jgi:hypothetical protein